MSENIRDVYVVIAKLGIMRVIDEVDFECSCWLCQSILVDGTIKIIK